MVEIKFSSDSTDVRDVFDLYSGRSVGVLKGHGVYL